MVVGNGELSESETSSDGAVDDGEEEVLSCRYSDAEPSGENPADKSSGASSGSATLPAHALAMECEFDEPNDGPDAAICLEPSSVYYGAACTGDRTDWFLVTPKHHPALLDLTLLGDGSPQGSWRVRGYAEGDDRLAFDSWLTSDGSPIVWISDLDQLYIAVEAPPSEGVLSYRLELESRPHPRAITACKGKAAGSSCSFDAMSVEYLGACSVGDVEASYCDI